MEELKKENLKLTKLMVMQQVAMDVLKTQLDVIKEEVNQLVNHGDNDEDGKADKQTDEVWDPEVL